MATQAAPEAPGPNDQRLYVYYRVAQPRLDATLAAVRQMQARLLLAHPQVQAELLRRPELVAGEVTLMEAYAVLAPGALGSSFEDDLAQAAQALPQPRHTERFTRL